MESLSGGNQQRALLALIKPGSKLLLLEHPTRGLDVESIIYLWGMLKERCHQGEAIIFTSSDLDELLHYSDRILVFFAGRISGPLDAATTTVDELGHLIGGGSLANGPESAGSKAGGSAGSSPAGTMPPETAAARRRVRWPEGRRCLNPPHDTHLASGAPAGYQLARNHPIP